MAEREIHLSHRLERELVQHSGDRRVVERLAALREPHAQAVVQRLELDAAHVADAAPQREAVGVARLQRHHGPLRAQLELRVVVEAQLGLCVKTTQHGISVGL
jgi:dethiobiotin synthetase